jgi:hypothetical protein
VKLVDFGIARAVDPDRAHKSKSGTLKGKYGYMSPEQVIEQQLDARSDLFSVGVVLAELLTGRRLFAAANELDVLLMVRDAKLSRFDKYGVGIEPNLSEIVRKALKKPVDERWQSAAQFRDAIGEWLFDNRFRVTPKSIADVVTELRESVISRRSKTDDPEIAVSRSPSEDAAPMIAIEGETSMPVISLSYEGPPDKDKVVPAPEDKASGRPISVSDLAAAVPRTVTPVKTTARAETVPARPAGMGTPVQGVPPLRPPPIVETKRQSEPRRVSTEDRPRLKTNDPVRPSSLRAVEDSGVIDVPIADTISAAVERITLPDVDLSGRTETVEDIGEPRIAQGSADAPSEDSAMRAFEDLTERPQALKSSVRPVTEEEALRKKPPTPPALADIAEAPDDAGDFSVTSPLRVMFRLMTARATGLLVVAVGGIKKEIYVRDGQPEYVSSNVASELFGNYLVTKGVLSDGELAMALAMMPHYGGKLGDTLVGLGLLKPLEVFRHLTRQVRTKIIDVCTWNKGSFGWYAGRENPREAFPLDFNAFEILGAGGMALSDDHIDLWIQKQANTKLRASRTRRVGPERFEVKGLVDLCDMLDGKRTVGDLVDVQSDRDSRLRTGRMLCLLEACDLARPA